MENSKKIAKKLKILKKYHYGFISIQNRLENAEKERKLKLSFCFVPTRSVTENFIKIKKKLKNTIMDSFQAKTGWKMMRKRESKSYRSVSVLPNA